MKCQSINFRDFMADDYKVTRKVVPYNVVATSLFMPVYSIIPTGLMAKAYLVIFGVGAVCIVVGILEQLALVNGRTELARGIIEFFKFVMPLVYIAAVIYFVLTNPIFNWL